MEGEKQNSFEICSSPLNVAQKKKKKKRKKAKDTKVYCFGWNPGAQGEHLVIQLLSAFSWLLVTHF